MPSVILSRDYKDVTESKAKITITAQGFKLPSDTDTKEYSNMQYQYRVNSGRWQDMSSNNTTITIMKDNDLHMEVEIDCRITYKVDYYEFVTTGTGETATTTREWVESKTETSSAQSNSVDVYFHPGSFDMGATSDSNSANNIIAKVLTKSKIDDWIAHYQKAYHWKNQSNTNYDVDLSVTAKAPVTATWFNKCMVAMNEFGKGYKTNYEGGPNGHIITATLINQMNFSGKN